LLPEPHTRADWGQLLRTVGFAAAPGVLLVLACIGPIRSIVFVATEAWMIAAMVVAVRQALDYTSTLRAVAVCAIGWVCQLLVAVAVFNALVPRPDVVAFSDSGPPRQRIGAGSVGVVRPSAVAPPVH